ncbi:helix-turn-helix domain-containing protein [Nocardia rhamnosiphila]|uniref:helix-turn-helix domain-containing protein n=1 Tax=Nocardia rhamnosiphila TaxID=426716 RepID=UPI0033EB752D
MRGSAPTSRVLDIVELLARAGEDRLRFSDVVRTLGLTQATAHAILTTLCDRGWAARDPLDKSFGPGPALTALAAAVQASRPLAAATRSAAADLADELGYAASVVERIGDHLVITAFISGSDDYERPARPGERIPYAPPFGAAFAAWAPAAEQQAWIRRAGGDTAVAARLEQVLAHTRARGFDVDRTTPALLQAAQLVGILDEDGLPPHVRRIMDTLLAEFTSIGYLSDDDPERDSRSVFSITAPVIDDHETVAMIVGVHPMRVLNATQIAEVGRHVMRAATTASTW